MKWMLWWLIPCFGAFAESTTVPFSFEATSVSYHDQSLLLEGDIYLKHSLGNISADKGSVIQERYNDTIYHYFSLQGHVHLQFRKGGSLLCSEAEVDLKTEQGNFYGTPLAPVSYSEPSTENSLLPPLVIKSQTTSFYFHKYGTYYPIHRIDCYKNVEIDYYGLFQSKSHKACYLNNNPEKHSSLSNTEMTLQLSPEHAGDMCMITRDNGDTIYAHKITVSHPQDIVQGNAVHGTLMLENDKPLHLKGDAVTWDHKLHTLTLVGNTTARTSDWCLKGSGELQATQQLQEGKWVWESCQSHGTTQLTTYDVRQLQRSFLCQGSIVIDQSKQECHILSPHTGKGAPAEQQNHYHDHASDIYADDIYFTYHRQVNNMLLTFIRLKGHVRMLQQAPFDPHEQKAVEQYVLADSVDYYPEDEHFVISAEEGNRVLLLDNINNSQVSADTLHIWRNSGGKSPTIQGIGNVKISLSQMEVDTINKAFQ